MRCEACKRTFDGPEADADWADGLCDDCWRLTNRVTRGWYVLVQRSAEEAGWPDRLLTEHNILWDILVAQARQARNPPPPRPERDMTRVHINLTRVKERPPKFRR